MNERESIVGKSIQDVVRKLISEEYYAYKLYLMSGFAVRADGKATVCELFGEISKDELDDHMKSLIDWCAEYGVDVPCTESEFAKLADRKVSRQVAAVKKGKDALYYIEEAIKSEELALDSYGKAVKTPGIPEFTDLQSVLWNIYYDEAEHLRKLKTAAIACQAGCDMILA